VQLPWLALQQRRQMHRDPTGLCIDTRISTFSCTLQSLAGSFEDCTGLGKQGLCQYASTLPAIGVHMCMSVSMEVCCFIAAGVLPAFLNLVPCSSSCVYTCAFAFFLVAFASTLQALDAKAKAVACSSSRSCVTTYPTQEQYGLIWVWPSAGPAAAAQAGGDTAPS
jgi:hypothetical protein